MGTTLSTKVFYGYVWHDSPDSGDVDLGDFDSEPAEPGDHVGSNWPQIVAARRGHIDPWKSFTPSKAGSHAQREAADDAWIAANQQRIDQWRETCDAIDAEFGVDLGHHGHSDYAAPHLSSYVHAEGTWTDGLDISDLPEVDPVWRERLDRWLAEFNVPAPQDAPRWWVVASLG